MSIEPNIFSFATSELSQDAFICWLVSYVNYTKDIKLNQCAKDFIALLYNTKYQDKPITGENIKDIKELKRQYLHTDVYFQATIHTGGEDRVISFIVEDKTHTSHHSNQLEIYKNKIKGDKIEEDEIICIYFKTGYIFPWDEKAQRDYGFGILDYKKIYEFLQNYETDNLIFKSYKKYIEEEFYTPYTTWTKKFLEEEDKEIEWKGGKKHLLSFSFVQWEVMHMLKEECPGVLGSCASEEADRIYNGTNRSGDPWTQMRFVEVKDFYEKGVNETLFYRIDKGKGGYYLSLRQYAKVSESDQKERKKKRLEQFRKHFEDASSDESSSSPLKFGKVTNKGTYESEVAVLYFKDNSPAQVLNNLGAVHKNFIERIKTSELAPFSE